MTHSMENNDRNVDESRRIILLPSEEISLWDLVCLSCFNLPYGFIIGTFGLFLLPASAARLFPERQSVYLGFSLLIVGITQLVCPIIGRMSDNWKTDTIFGKRKPFITISTIGGIASEIIMLLSSIYRFAFFYYVGLFVGMICINVIYSVQTGIIPDYVSAKVQGTASGIIAVQGVIGSALGFILLVASAELDIQYVYTIHIFSVPISVLILWYKSVQIETKLNRFISKNKIAEINPLFELEEISTGATTPAAINSFVEKRYLWKQCSLTLEDVWKSYTLDIKEGRDFMWVVVGRTFYYIGVSVQSFLTYYLRDIVGFINKVDRQRKVGIIALASQFAAASIAYPLGKMSDLYNVDRKMLIYTACALMTLLYAAFLICPLIPTNKFLFMTIAAMIYGIGNGAFLSVDYALALSTIPSTRSTTESLGLWGVAAFIGSAVGPLIWGYLIQTFGGNSASSFLEDTYYDFNGYMAMVVGGCIATTLSALSISMVTTPYGVEERREMFVN